MAAKDGALKPAAEEALAVAPETGTTVQPTWAKEQWDIIKSKARDAREYVVTKTRQAFSIFGETKVESADMDEGASKDEPSSSQ
jgi:hypothetical protein